MTRSPSWSVSSMELPVICRIGNSRTAMMTAMAPKTTEALEACGLFAKGEDTSLAKKARKERARMLTRQRMVEIAAKGGK